MNPIDHRKIPDPPKPPPLRTVGEEGGYLFPLIIALFVSIIFLGGLAVGLGMQP